MNKKLKLGFIGGGLNSAVGRTHKIAIEMDSKFDLVCGAFSRHEDVNIQTGTEYGLDRNRVYLYWSDMLRKEKEQIDAVVVLTPTPAHTEIILKLLELKIPVICEKALTSNISDARKIIDTIEKQDGFLAVTYNYTGYPMVREIRNMVIEGVIGTIHQIHVEMPQEGFLRLTPNGKAAIPQQWRLVDDEIPTVSLDLGVHLHNMVQFLTNEKPISLVARQMNYGNFKGIADNVICIADYTNEVSCCFWYGKTALGQSNGLRIRIFGEKGSLEWLQLRPEEVHFNDNMGTRYKIDKGSSNLKIASQDRYSRFKAGHPAGFIEAFANYYWDIAAAIAEHKEKRKTLSEYVFSAYDAYDGLLLSRAINDSNQKRQWIKF